MLNCQSIILQKIIKKVLDIFRKCVIIKTVIVTITIYRGEVKCKEIQNKEN